MTTSTKTKNPTCRRRLETKDGVFWPVHKIPEQPNAKELLESAIDVLAMELKDVLWGVAPLLNREIVLGLCLKIIDEDFNPDGPQTDRTLVERLKATRKGPFPLGQRAGT